MSDKVYRLIVTASYWINNKPMHDEDLEDFFYEGFYWKKEDAEKKFREIVNINKSFREDITEIKGIEGFGDIILEIQDKEIGTISMIFYKHLDKIEIL